MRKAEALRAVEDPADAARQLRDLQEEWKKVAAGPRDQGQVLWRRFKTAIDEVRGRTDAFFETQAQARAENLQRKLALCERAEALAESSDWIATADAIKALQAEWKTIGPGPRKDEQARVGALPHRVRSVLHAASRGPRAAEARLGRQPREEGSALRARRDAGRIERLGRRGRRAETAAGRVEDDRSGTEEQVGGDLAPVPRRVRSLLRALQAASHPRSEPAARRARGADRRSRRARRPVSPGPPTRRLCAHSTHRSPRPTRMLQSRQVAPRPRATGRRPTRTPATTASVGNRKRPHPRHTRRHRPTPRLRGPRRPFLQPIVSPPCAACARAGRMRPCCPATCSRRWRSASRRRCQQPSAPTPTRSAAPSSMSPPTCGGCRISWLARREACRAGARPRRRGVTGIDPGDATARGARGQHHRRPRGRRGEAAYGGTRDSPVADVLDPGWLRPGGAGASARAALPARLPAVLRSAGTAAARLGRAAVGRLGCGIGCWLDAGSGCRMAVTGSTPAGRLMQDIDRSTGAGSAPRYSVRLQPD